jgi:predicted flap endonuclease-1-like 5' DNA nuclease
MIMLAIALVSTAVAFTGGWLLGKVYFSGPTAVGVSQDKHHLLLKAQRSRYRKRVMAIHNLVERHEETREQIRNRLGDLQDALEKRTRALQITRKELEQEREHQSTGRDELGLLRIERDELVARVLRLESEKTATIPNRPATTQSHVAELKATLGHMRELLANREHQIRQFSVQLQHSQEQAHEYQFKLSEIKRRMQPLTHQLRVQKQLIQRANQLPAQTHENDERADDLKSIRGIGPALERRLQAYGIRRFGQLAEMSDSELASMATHLAIAPTLPLRNQWIEQARVLRRQSGN